MTLVQIIILGALMQAVRSFAPASGVGSDPGGVILAGGFLMLTAYLMGNLFKKIGLPESVTQTVFDRMKTERQVLIQRAESQGKSEAQQIQSAADAEAAKTIANAQANATRLRAEGEAEAAKTLPVFQQNPDLAVFLLRIGALQQSLNQRATLIFDERTPPFDLFRTLPTNAPGH